MTFKLFNIPVYIHPSFWIFLLFFADVLRQPNFDSLILAGIFFVSLLVHEMGHALTARFFGAKPAVILEAFGGYAQYNNYGISPKRQFLITLNGPLFESLLILVSYYFLMSGIFDKSYYATLTLYLMMKVNIIWVLLNLIPIKPLDGGNLLRYILLDKFGYRSERITNIIGLVIACIAIPYLFLIGLYFFSVLLCIFAFRNYQELKLSRVSLAENPFSLYLKSIEMLKDNNASGAKELLKGLIKSKDSHIRNPSLEALADIYYRAGDSAKAYQLLLKADVSKEGKPLLCKLAFLFKNYKLVAQYAFEIYAQEPSFEIALLNAKAYAHLNQHKLASGWLKTASQFGPEYQSEIDTLLQTPPYTVLNQ